MRATLAVASPDVRPARPRAPPLTPNYRPPGSGVRPVSGRAYRFGAFLLDADTRELHLGDAAVALPARVLDCLVYLIERRERAVGRDELISAVYGRVDVSDAQLGQLIVRARRAVHDDGQEQHTIRTIPRFGFRWVAQTRAVDADWNRAPPVPALAPAVAQPAGLGGSREAAPGREDHASAMTPSATRTPGAMASPDHAQPMPAGDVPQAERAYAIEAPGAANAEDAQPGSRPAAPAATRADTHLATAPAGRWRVASGFRRARLLRWGAVAVLGCGLVGLAIWHRATTQVSVATLDTRAPLAVLPTDVEPGDEDWMRLGLMEFVADRLRRGGVPVAPSDTTLALLPREGADATGADAHLRQRTGADRIIVPRLRRGDDGWRMELSATDRDGLRLQATATDPDVMVAARLASDRLLAALGHPPPVGEDDPGLDEHLQRAQAAMLANQLEAAREILVTATQLRQGDPLLRYLLVQVDFREGRYAEGLAELDALLSDAEVARDGLLRARLLNTRGVFAIRIDRYAQAERDFEAALQLLDRERDAAEWGRAMNGLGITRMAQGRVEEAAADLGDAREQLLRTGDALGLGRLDSNLGHVERLRDRPAQAVAYFAKAAEDFESLGAINELISVQSMLIEMHLQLLQYEQAGLAMQRYWAWRPRVRDPAQLAQIDLARAKVLLRAGRLREAAGLLDPPRSDTRPTAFQLHQYELYRAELALASGQPALALRLADNTLRLGDELAQPVRDWLQLQRERAALAADLPHGSAIVLPAGADASIPARLATAIVQARSGQAAAADASFRAALAQAQASGSPALLVEVASDYGPWLIERGHTGEAARLAGLVAPWSRSDYHAARVLGLIHRALGHAASAEQAAGDMARLAGEREPRIRDLR